MEEDGAAGVGFGFWGVVVDEEFEDVGVVALFHLCFFLPGGLGFVGEEEVLVVEFGGWVFDPEVAGADLVVGEA